MDYRHPVLTRAIPSLGDALSCLFPLERNTFVTVSDMHERFHSRKWSSSTCASVQISVHSPVHSPFQCLFQSPESSFYNDPSYAYVTHERIARACSKDEDLWCSLCVLLCFTRQSLSISATLLVSQWSCQLFVWTMLLPSNLHVSLNQYCDQLCNYNHDNLSRSAWYLKLHENTAQWDCYIL